MDVNTRNKMLAVYAQIRLGLEKSQELIAAMDANLIGNDGEATKATMLERLAQQIKLLNYLELQLSRQTAK